MCNSLMTSTHTDSNLFLSKYVEDFIKSCKILLFKMLSSKTKSDFPATYDTFLLLMLPLRDKGQNLKSSKDPCSI